MNSQLEQLAEEIATNAHRGIFRKDGKTPYIEHPRAVVAYLRKQNTDLDIRLGFDNPGNNPYQIEQYIVGWLHDVIEDTDVIREDLLKVFSVRIVDAVVALTKLPKGEESYLSYLNRVKSNDLALTVKLADLFHNMSDLKPGNLRDKYELTVWFLENAHHSL